MQMHLASGSGNVFGYLWADEVPSTFDGPAWARALCARGIAFGLDGLFLLHRPEAGRWIMDHWDTDGAFTFCSNGTRAALAVPGAPTADRLEGLSSGAAFALHRDGAMVGLRMPEGEGFGLRPLPPGLPEGAGFGFVGNPQLTLEVPEVAEVDLAVVAPPLRHHPSIPGGTNVNVVQVDAPGRARIRSWERGVEGETLCCGTGCAVTAAWLAERTGTREWRFETASPDAVTVKLAWAAPGQWQDLWLYGPLRFLGTVTLGTAFRDL
jgi:diaminopimelate epimerase